MKKKITNPKASRRNVKDQQENQGNKKQKIEKITDTKIGFLQ